MKQASKFILTTVFLALAFFVGIGHHGLAFAASNSTQGSSSSNTCTPPTISTPGVHVPTGSAAWTFTYNCQTGMWGNSYFVFNPITDQTSPVTPISYTYNAATGLWDSNQWTYDAATKVYVQTVVSVAQPPAGAITVGGPTVNNSNNPTDLGGTSSNTSAVSGDSTSNASTSTDPNIINNSKGSQTLNSTNGITLNDLLGQIANTGDASVAQNTTAGGATTGNAADMANIINMIESQSSLAGESPVTFVENLYGNVNGNLLIDPTQLAQALQSNTSADPTSPYDTTINSENSGAINNNISLLANSGNANVESNTSAGNATSGNAVAMANIVNMIDSLIASNQSFLGEINIYGNLYGNILMPSQFLDDLLASNAPSATVPLSKLNTSTVNAAFNNNEGITNNIDTIAASGNATVSGNSSAGSALTGSASTNVTLFNLTGNEIVGSNVMLVFVNVLGNWVGLLMNAPAGSTAAAYGSGIVQNTVNPGTTNINSSNNDQINNNVNVAANSGNAAVTDNTSAGNATSGNAEAGVNILNIDNSQFDLTGWFGILFINVFGNWDGSFGVAPAPSTTSNITSSSSSTTGGGNPIKHAVLEFTSPGSDNTLASDNNNSIHLVSDSLNKSTTTFSPKVANSDSPAQAARDNLVSIISASIVVGVGLVLFTIERILSTAKAKK